MYMLAIRCWSWDSTLALGPTRERSPIEAIFYQTHLGTLPSRIRRRNATKGNRNGDIKIGFKVISIWPKMRRVEVLPPLSSSCEVVARGTSNVTTWLLVDQAFTGPARIIVRV